MKAPVYQLSKKKEKTKKEDKDITRLLPNKEWGYSKSQEIEYYYKALCHIASDGNSTEAYRMYYEVSLLQIIEILMIKKAMNYE